MSTDISNLLIDNKQKTAQMIVDNITRGKVVLNQEFALLHYDYPRFSKLEQLIDEWKELYQGNKINENLERFNAICNEMFDIFLSGRILGWITGIMIDTGAFSS